MKKKLFVFFNTFSIIAALVAVGIGYYKFTSHLIFKDSVTHLEEVFSQSNQSLEQLVNKKWMNMKDWSNYFRDVQDDSMMDGYICDLKENNTFIEFYFLSREGEYITQDGETGYINLGENLTKLIIDRENIAMKASFHGQDEFELFAIPCSPGEYKGFKYEAFAISLDNNRLIETLENKVYNEYANTYVIHSDGRVWLDNVGPNKRSVYNFLGMIRESSDLSENEIEKIRNALRSKEQGVMTVEFDGERFYLVYQPVDFDDWTLIGLVPQKVVNANMTRLQIITLFVGIGSVTLIMLAIGIIMVRRSRSRLRRMGTEIKYREKLFTALSDNVDDVFIVVDKDSMKVSYVSENIDAILGISEDEVRKDMYVIEKTADSDYNMDIGGKFEGLQPGNRIELKQCCYINRHTNEKVWLSITILCADVEGVIRYIVVMSNRTKEVMAQLELQDALGNAQAANKAKSTFLSNISHDIRTPMNAIIGFTGLASADIDDKVKVRDYLDKINSSGKHLLSLINDVLDMSRIESGKIHIEESEVCLPDMISDIRTIVSGQIRDKNLCFDIIADDVSDEYIFCDRVHLEQVILNILINAIKFTPLGGKVSLSVSQSTVSDDNVYMYTFCVKDTGIGMSAEFAKRIFEPFEREQTTTVSGIEGFGLGMAIAKNIIDLMGGTVRVETESGKGTEFIISLKFRIPRERRKVEPIEKLRGKKALVISDDDNFISGVGKKLKLLCIDSQSISDVQSEDMFDICIIDGDLPDGTARCLQDFIKDHTIVIFAGNENKSALFNGSIQEFCEKPLFLSDLCNILKKHSDESCNVKKEYIPKSPGRNFEGKRVLIVEDNELNREIAENILQKLGFFVDTAEDGEKAVEKVKNSVENKYHVILMDVHMPVMDGHEATRQIRNLENKALASTPILAMTANAFKEDEQAAEECGMNGFVSKPINIDHLISALAEVVDISVQE